MWTTKNMRKQVQEVLSLCVQERFFIYLLPWHACIIAAIFAIVTSLIDILWSIANLVDEEDVIVFFLLIIVLAESVLFILVSFVMIFGIFKRNKWLLLPWLIVAILDILLAFTITFVQLSIPGRNAMSSCIVSLAGLIVVIFLSLFTLYVWMAVYTQYCENRVQRISPTNTVVESAMKSHNSSHIYPENKGVTFKS